MKRAVIAGFAGLGCFFIGLLLVFLLMAGIITGYLQFF